MLHYDDMSIEIPPWSGVPRDVAELWRMHKGDDVAVFAVWTHPDGAQLRLTVNGEIKPTDATYHVFAVDRSTREAGAVALDEGMAVAPGSFGR